MSSSWSALSEPPPLPLVTCAVGRGARACCLGAPNDDPTAEDDEVRDETLNDADEGTIAECLLAPVLPRSLSCFIGLRRKLCHGPGGRCCGRL